MDRRQFVSASLAAAGLTVIPFSAQANQTASPNIESYNLPGEGSVNSYVLVGPSSQVIVDCQRTLVEARALLSLVQAQGKPVEAIIITHEHIDHTGGLALFTQTFPHVPVYASTTTRDAIAASKGALVPVMKRLFGDAFPDDIPVPNQKLDDQIVLELAGRRWKVHLIGPCEAQGMTLLYAEQDGMLIAADLVGNRMTPWLVEGTSLAWMRELEAAKSRYAPVRLALPGHGAPAPMTELIEAQLGYLRFFHDLVRAEMGSDRRMLDNAARARIRTTTEARFPGYLRVAPPPNLIEMNADAVARELRAT